MFRSIWAEDGWTLLCSRERGVGRCLLEPVNGYWPVFHRAYSEVVAPLPVSLWPVMLPISGAALTALLSVVLARATAPFDSLVLRGVIVFSPVMLPTLGLEFINVVGNVHWIVLMVSILHLLSVDFGAPTRRRDHVLLFLGGLSGPAGFATIVAVLGVTIARRVTVRRSGSVLVAAVTGFVIQATMIAVHRGDGRLGSSLDYRERAEAIANDVLGLVPGLNATREVPISFLSYSSAFTPVVLAVAIAFLGLLALVRARHERVRVGGAMLCTTLSISVFLALTIDPNPRYEYVVGLLGTTALLWMLSGASVPQRAGSVAACLLMILWLPAFGVGPFRSTGSDVGWRTQVEEARLACDAGAASVSLHFAPERFLEELVPCEALFNPN